MFANGARAQQNEVFYGSFSALKGIDGYLYLFGSSSTGLRVARVPEGSVADRKSVRIFL